LSVSLTWLYLLYEYWLQGSGDPLVLGILLGGSAVGGMYYLFPKMSERYQIFKFPLLISAFWFAYQLLGLSNTLLEEMVILIVIWGIFFTIFLFYTNSKLQTLGRKIIECCKNW
jgi:type II secretory pathway component PulF